MDKFIKKGQILKYHKSVTCWLSNAPAIVLKICFLEHLIIKRLHDFNDLAKSNLLIISVFQLVPGVPCVKMERFA